MCREDADRGEDVQAVDGSKFCCKQKEQCGWRLFSPSAYVLPADNLPPLTEPLDIGNCVVEGKSLTDITDIALADMAKRKAVLETTRTEATAELEASAHAYLELLESHGLALDETNKIQKNEKLHNFFTQIKELLVKEGSAVTVATKGEKRRMLVIGDIHASLYSLISILQVSITSMQKDITDLKMVEGSRFMPCDERIHYAFLGDYVDRGEHGLEVVMLLLSYKALCPLGITLLAGNHEAQEINEAYGFFSEVESKLDDPYFVLINQVFSNLPVLAVLEGYALAMHGGIGPWFYKRCQRIKTGDFRPCMQKNEGLWPDILDELTWSDPDPHLLHNSFEESNRGRGVLYSNSAAEKFLNATGLQVILRGHEELLDGIRNSGKVTTVFSAADYCGSFRDLQHGRPPWLSKGCRSTGRGNKAGFLEIHAATSLSDFMTFQTTLSGEDARTKAADAQGIPASNASFMQTGLAELHHMNSYTETIAYTRQRLKAACPKLQASELESFKEARMDFKEEVLETGSGNRSMEDLAFWKAQSDFEEIGEAFVGRAATMKNLCSVMKDDMAVETSLLQWMPLSQPRRQLLEDEIDFQIASRGLVPELMTDET